MASLQLPRLGFGCWQLGSKGADDYWGIEYTQEQADRLVAAAIAEGITYMDTAEDYAKGDSEKQLGEVLKSLTPEARAAVVIGSKILPNNCMNVAEHVDGTLARLGVDCIDLYMVHWPIDANSMAHFAGGHASFGEAITTVNNDEVPPNEQAFRDLLAAQASGKIKHIGCSNFGVAQLKEVMALGVTVAVNELCYSLIFRAIEFEIAPFCKANDIQVLCYSPLQQGILTNRSLNCADDVPVYRARTRHFSGKRDKSRHGEEGHEELLFDTLRSLRSIAEAEKLTMLELSLAWPLHNPAVSCIIAGITKDEHVQSNAAASKVQLSAECLAKVDEATTALKNAMGSNADLWQGGADGRIK